MDSKDPRKNLLKGHAFEAWTGRLRYCIAPGDCTRQPIKAHSIQRGGSLSRIGVEGHVIMFRQRQNLNTGPTVDYESIGIGEATVFTGLCAEHDFQLFKHIDQIPFDKRDSRALFLHAYRAVLREAHVCNEVAIKLQTVYKKKSELGLINGDIPTREGMIAVAHLAVAYEMWLYKEQFDAAYLAEDYSMLINHVVDFGVTGPTIAVSSLFSVDEIQGEQDVQRIALNVLPLANGRTCALLSCTVEDYKYLSAWLEPLLVAQGIEQKRRLSHLILERCENVVISPELFASWNQERQDTILHLFTETISVNSAFSNDERLNLFQRDTV